MKKEHCANEGNGGYHPRPCSADHIGPISLGFCHRPEFQFLCKPCNSAKNNRMYYSDVLHLIEVEKTGETVASPSLMATVQDTLLLELLLSQFLGGCY